MLMERDYTRPELNYKPKHPVDVDAIDSRLRLLGSHLNAIRRRLEADMPTYAGRRDIVEQLRKAETAVAFVEMQVWGVETKVEEEADAIYQTDLPDYVKRALVDAGYRTLHEVYQYQNCGRDKAPGIGEKGDQHIREWKERQDIDEIYPEVWVRRINGRWW